MIKKEIALKINVGILFLAAVMDFVRGFMHTYHVKYAATQLAKIEPLSDSLVLMGSFGMSNFLTAFVYLLILWKARQLAPYALFLIPLSYIIGGIGLFKIQNVQMESEFIGQHMMSVYLTVCLIASLIYFTSSLKKQLQRS